FVDVNSAAIPETLVESEFFGIEEGVATGVKKRIGLFEQANSGTLFIDEIGDMSLATQSKILRVLEEKQVRRVGSNRNINVDVRLISATNKNLKQAIDNKTFREDLYYRLNVFEITLPPLRERKEDIPLLMEHFANKFAHQMGKAIQGFSPEATEILINYEWQGNVRELANVVERAVILTKQPLITVQHLPPDFKDELEPPIPATELLVDAVNHFKKQVILKTIRECANNKSEAARRLGISRVYLFKLLKQLGVGEEVDR
ncbi:MAG: sigma-54-dependent Fis family transcriptional regulator, partial [bacterium]